MIVVAQPARAQNAAVAGAIAGFVKPAYAHFHAISAEQREGMEALCDDQSAERLDAARNSFLTLVSAWSEVEIIRFGPVTQDNRLERILFWPDRKSIGLKQVQAALAGKDASASDAATLKDKSVAMQGLGALEFVLFGTGSDALNAPGDPYRCAYGRAIARNIESMAGSILAGWQEPDGISRQWANPGPDNPLYRNEDEALTELLDVFVHGLEMVRDVRLNGFLGQGENEDKPKRAIFWRSDATVVSIDGNLKGLRALFDVSGIAERLPQDAEWLAQGIDFEFDNAERTLGLASGPIAETLEGGEKREALVVTRMITSHLSEMFGVQVSGRLGLTAGFSSLDGD